MFRIGLSSKRKAAAQSGWQCGRRASWKFAVEKVAAVAKAAHLARVHLKLQQGFRQAVVATVESHAMAARPLPLADANHRRHFQ